MRLKRPIRTRFRYGYPHGLTSPHTTNSQAHSSKGTQSPQKAPTACRHTVSGTISLPSRGTFHLSLTVLVRYRSPGSIQAYRVVPPDSHGISRAPCYLGTLNGESGRFRLRDYYPLWRAFRRASTNLTLSHSTTARQTQLESPTTPPTQRLPAITRERFSLIRFRSPLLTESRLFSLPVGNEMFHFPAFPPHALYIQARVTPHDWCRVSPFGHPRITARLAAPRGLSQPPTSFIGSWCQGIHRVPLITWPQRCSRPLCSSQPTGATTDTPLRPHHEAYRHGPASRMVRPSQWTRRPKPSRVHTP